MMRRSDWKIFCAGMFLCLQGVTAGGKVYADNIRDELKQLLAPYRAIVGVAVYTDQGDTLTVNGGRSYPAMSVFKVPVAVAVLSRMSAFHIDPGYRIPMRPDDFRTGTYSPMIKDFPEGADSLTLSQLLKYCVSQSDNNACDRLIRYVGGLNNVRISLQKIGVRGWTIKVTEDDMHRNLEAQQWNTCSPYSAVQLFHRIWTSQWVSGDYKCFLQRLLADTSTGKDKLLAGLPPMVVLAHKTGSSDRLPDGMKIGDNDAGIVCLPNGRFYAVAVFVTESYEDDRTNAAIIAKVSEQVYKWFSRLPSDR